MHHLSLKKAGDKALNDTLISMIGDKTTIFVMQCIVIMYSSMWQYIASAKKKEIQFFLVELSGGF